MCYQVTFAAELGLHAIVGYKKRRKGIRETLLEMAVVECTALE